MCVGGGGGRGGSKCNIIFCKTVFGYMSLITDSGLGLGHQRKTFILFYFVFKTLDIYFL